jgi:glyoxylase-like metal-dependent hydrolase (beta-lactamase superfamily II)
MQFDNNQGILITIEVREAPNFVIVKIFNPLKYKTMSTQLPQSSSFLVKDFGKVKIHTLISPDAMFANATHIIELPSQLILVDGHYFAQYASEFRALADSLQKKITRFYISHDHPDHYLGMGDAFAEVEVYALKEIKESIEQNGEHILAEKRSAFGPLIASKLKSPNHVVALGMEVIEGVTFIFEKVEGAESGAALVIKLPELGVLIAQDVVYNNTHLFIAGPTATWKAAMEQILGEKEYDIVLAGHGKPATQSDIQRAIQYLDKATKFIQESKNGEEYKSKILAEYPDYAGAGLIDIYLPYLFA